MSRRRSAGSGSRSGGWRRWSPRRRWLRAGSRRCRRSASRRSARASSTNSARPARWAGSNRSRSNRGSRAPLRTRCRKCGSPARGRRAIWGGCCRRTRRSWRGRGWPIARKSSASRSRRPSIRCSCCRRCWSTCRCRRPSKSGFSRGCALTCWPRRRSKTSAPSSGCRARSGSRLGVWKSRATAPCRACSSASSSRGPKRCRRSGTTCRSSRRRARAVNASRLRGGCWRKPRAGRRSIGWRSSCARRGSTGRSWKKPSPGPGFRRISPRARCGPIRPGARSLRCWPARPRGCRRDRSPNTCRWARFPMPSRVRRRHRRRRATAGCRRIRS